MIFVFQLTVQGIASGVKMTEKFGNISQLVCFQSMDRIVLKYSEFKLAIQPNRSET